MSSTIQPLAATIYSSILQHGLTPNLVFLPIPAALFQAKRQVRSSSASSNAGAGSAPQQQAAGSAASNSLTPRGELDGALVASSVTYEDVRGHFGSAYVLLGYVVASRDQELMLNPADSDTLAPEDVVVALTHAQGERVWYAMSISLPPVLDPPVSCCGALAISSCIACVSSGAPM